MSKLTRARFERLRRNSGSVGEVAEVIGISAATFSNWECGQRGRAIPPKCVKRLAELLHVDACVLADEVGRAVLVDETAQLIA